MRATKYINLKKYIEGIPIRELKETFSGNPFRYTIEKILSSGSVMLSGYRIIKCVSNYYETLDGKSRENSTDNAYKNCELTRKLLNVNSAARLDCKECHRRCIELLECGGLRRKSGKKRQESD